MQKILDAIYNNFIIFICVTIFLILALIGYFVDKKIHKDSENTSFFSMGPNKNAKAPKIPKAKKDKKGKKEYKSVIIGGDGTKEVTAGMAAQQNATRVSAAPAVAPTPQAPAPQSPVALQPMQAPAAHVQTPVAPVQAPMANGTQIAAGQVPIQNAMPRPAASPVQAPVQAAPNQSTNINPTPVQVPVGMPNANQAPADDDNSPMNFNMNE